MKFRLVESQSEYYIRWWYDRFTRSWITQVFDSNRNEIANAYSGNKQDRDYNIEYFKKEYNTEDARKYAPGE